MKSDSLTGFQWGTLEPDYAQLYEDLNSTYNSMYSASAHRLAELGRLSAGMIAVDIGCGTGISTQVLLEIVGASGKVVGLDISQTMLDRAKEKLKGFPNVILFQRDAFSVGELIAELHLTGQVHLVCSNFTYYYLYEQRDVLHRQIYEALIFGGKWAFNMTSYLGQIEYNGHTYNRYDNLFTDTLDSILKQRGYPQGVNSRSESRLPTIDAEAEELKSAGFRDVQIEAFELPLTPSQAYRFTIEGFYKFGSKPGFSSTLHTMSISERVAVIEETLQTVQAEIDSSGERPTIFNLVATK